MRTVTHYAVKISQIKQRDALDGRRSEAMFKGELKPLKTIVSGYLVVLLIGSGHNLDMLAHTVLNLRFLLECPPQVDSLLLHWNFIRR